MNLSLVLFSIIIVLGLILVLNRKNVTLSLPLAVFVGAYTFVVYKIPIKFITTQLDIPFIYVIISAIISVLSTITISLVSRDQFLKVVELLSVLIVGIIFGTGAILLREFETLGAVTLILAECAPVGIYLMSTGPSDVSIGSIEHNSNSDMGSTGSSNNSTTGTVNNGGSGSTSVRGSSTSFPWNSRNLREASEAEVTAISTGEWYLRQNERIQEARELKRKVSANNRLVKNIIALGNSVPQSILDNNKRDLDAYHDTKRRVIDAQKRLDYLRNLQ